MRPAFLIASLLCLVLPAVAADDSRPTAEQLEFFEKEIRPILVGTNSNGGFGRNQLGGVGGHPPTIRDSVLHSTRGRDTLNQRGDYRSLGSLRGLLQRNQDATSRRWNFHWFRGTITAIPENSASSTNRESRP